MKGALIGPEIPLPLSLPFQDNITSQRQFLPIQVINFCSYGVGGVDGVDFWVSLVFGDFLFYIYTYHRASLGFNHSLRTYSLHILGSDFEATRA